MKLVDRKKWFHALGYILAAIISSGLLYFLYDDWTPVLCDSVVSLIVYLLTLWTALLAVRNYPAKAGIITYALIVGLLTGFITWYASIYFLYWFFPPGEPFYQILEETQICRLLILMILSSGVLMVYASQKQVQSLKAQLRNSTDASELLREAELYKLRQQLQPHFLYNSLNSINALILINPSKAQEMTGRLSDLLRATVHRESQVLVPLDEELAYIESYLSIEIIRFGDRLDINIEKNYPNGMLIPPFILQPVMENAIKFGLYGVSGKVYINMQIVFQKGILEIKLTNPFDPLHAAPKGTGFGLQGVARRLFLLYARADLLSTHIEDRLFITQLKIPQDHD